jgi:anti-anti-sigma regulatory factor
MLRISWRATPDGGKVLVAEGRIGGPWLRELQAACESAIAEDGRLALDVAGVTFVDADGARVLRNLIRAGSTALVQASPYVSEILKVEEP